MSQVWVAPATSARPGGRRWNSRVARRDAERADRSPLPDGAPASVTVDVRVAPPRSTRSCSSVIRVRRDDVRAAPRNRPTSLPSICSIRSPGCRPAFSAALAGVTSPTTGSMTGLARGREQPGEQHERQHEIGDRSGRDHDRARASTLFSWKVRPGCQAAARLGRRVLRPLLAVQLHVAAERQPGQPPLRAHLVAPAQRWAGRTRSRTPPHARRASGRRGSGRARG